MEEHGRTWKNMEEHGRTIRMLWKMLEALQDASSILKPFETERVKLGTYGKFERKRLNDVEREDVRIERLPCKDRAAKL